jgi:hypothetical protein
MEREADSPLPSLRTTLPGEIVRFVLQGFSKEVTLPLGGSAF